MTTITKATLTMSYHVFGPLLIGNQLQTRVGGRGYCPGTCCSRMVTFCITAFLVGLGFVPSGPAAGCTKLSVGLTITGRQVFLADQAILTANGANFTSEEPPRLPSQRQP